MGRRIPKWTQKKLDERIARGFGRGNGEDYQPWLVHGDISSKGVTSRLWSPKLGRVLTFFSNVEKGAFLIAESRASFQDYHEQAPMDRELTLDICREFGIRHPRYFGTRIPAVLTIDGIFFASDRRPQMIDCKHSLTKRTARLNEQYAIRHEYARRTGCPILHITDKSYSWQLVHNLQWIRMSVLQRGYTRIAESDIDTCCTRLFAQLGEAVSRGSRQPLREFLQQNDTTHGWVRGLSAFCLRRLMWDHHVSFDMNVHFQQVLRGRVSALTIQVFAPRKILVCQ